MRLLQAKGTMGGRPPARTSRPAVSDGSKPAASLEAFRRIVGNMPRINQQQRQSDSQVGAACRMHCITVECRRGCWLILQQEPPWPIPIRQSSHVPSWPPYL